MSGKLLSLFSRPEFVEGYRARAERELAAQVVPVINLGRGRYRCRRCHLDFDSIPRLDVRPGAPSAQPCPRCDPAPDFDTIEAFLDSLSHDE